jgi:glycosyltransferase involved in cell wall biosynthesis
MKISVVIPCHNAVLFVGSTIRSVLAQAYSDVEVIIIDDGSSDDSWSKISAFGDRVKAVRQENHGACHARNQGARQATGEALMFLDADDLLFEDTLSALANTLPVKDNAVAACPWNYLQWTGERWMERPSKQSFRPPKDDYIRGWLSGWFVPPCGLLWSRSAFENVGGWDEALYANQDGDIILRALLSGMEIHQTSQGKALYRTFENTNRTSVSKKQTKRALLSRARVMEKVAQRLGDQGQLADYAEEIGRELHKIAKRGFDATEPKSDAYLKRLDEIAIKAREIAGTDAITGNRLHRLGCRFLGLRRKNALAKKLAQVGIGRQIRQAQ